MGYRLISEIHYKGWVVKEVQFYYYGPGSIPCTSHYVASRHGVSMNTNTLEGIKRMVDIKLATQERSWIQV
jgi:hypothetical protein